MITTLLLALLLQSGSGTDIRSDDRLETYRIEGKTSWELGNQIRQYGPPDPKSGTRYAAWTHWTVSWRYWYRSDAQGCRIDRSDVSLTTVTTIPEWVDQQRGSAELQREWAVFVERLKFHEAGHRTNGMQAAEAIKQMIDATIEVPDCDTLGNAVDAFGQAALASANKADIDYDATTRHGKTQGAVLP